MAVGDYHIWAALDPMAERRRIISRLLERARDRLYSAGFISNWRCEYTFPGPSTPGLRISVRYRSAREREVTQDFFFAEDEFHMGGIQAFADWLTTISREIEQRYRNLQAEALMANSAGVVAPSFAAIEALMANIQATEAIRAEILQRFGPQFFDAIWGEIAEDAPKKKEAEARAKALFKATAPEAFEILSRGEYFPLRGSAGGNYRLFPRATYCVEDHHGAKYCAVVPGVPLWDHLLGIKLIVERDEPQFLKVANVGRQWTWTEDVTMRVSPSRVNEIW